MHENRDALDFGWGGQLSEWLEGGAYRNFANWNIVLSVLDSSPVTGALDVGCGSGYVIERLAGKSTFSVGVDYSKEIIKFHQLHGKSNVVGGDITTLPFKNDSFQLTICHGLIEHFQDSVSVLRELYRVTASGGKSVITVPAKYSLFSLLVPLWFLTGGRYRHGWLEMVGKQYSRSSYARLLASAGWTVEKMGKYKACSLLDWARLPYNSKVAESIENFRILSSGLGIMLFAVCRKP